MKLPTSSLSFLIIVLGVLAFSPIEAKLHDQQVQELSMQQQQQQQQYYYSSPEEKRAHYWRNLQESTAWRQIGLDINGQRAADLSGFRVAMSDDGTRIAVSSLNANSQNIALADTGSVRVFQFSRNVEWNLLGQQIFGERAGEAIGEALHLSGDGQTLAFGSIKVFPYKGLVRVYRFNTQSQTWIKLGADIEGVSDRDRFGAAIDMSYDGNTMIVGGPFHDGDNTIRGHAVVFEYDSAANTWNTIGLPDDLDGRAEGERAGTSVAMNRDGSIVAVGAPTAEPETNSPGDNTGLTRVYQRTAFIDERNPWQLMGSPISGTVASEQNGFDVDLSDDGLIVAMGSPMYTFPAVGGRPAISLAGMARVFEYVNNAWVPRGSPITATAPVANQFFGRQVALSSDGYVLAVSAPYDKQRGSVAVYEFDDTAWSITPGGNVTSSQTQDLFGNSVARSGDGTRMVVGAAYADPNALVDAGRTEAFEFQTSTSGWSLKLDDVTSNFGAEDTPEFTFIFSGTAPPPVNDLALRYTAEILFAGCQFGAPSDNSVRPVSPTAAITASEAFRFTPQVEVDSATVTESGLFTDTGNGEGSMAYCLRIEVFDGAERKVFKEVDMNVRLDMSQDFEVRDFETTRLDNDKVSVDLMDFVLTLQCHRAVVFVFLSLMKCLLNIYPYRSIFNKPQYSTILWTHHFVMNLVLKSPLDRVVLLLLVKESTFALIAIHKKELRW